ncbi:carotenoid ester lipase precursor [Irpex rosettiformis]|uniref:Carotenoid ester lipase n=1 Tax=Irpex rosettiformis TaxID=378272 RepID=A0ACB8UAG8_9APHY|nr:carotenoid ester lipase precursor [Irpex rosettiformis]
MLGSAAYLWVAALAASSTSTFAQSTPSNSTTNTTTIIPQVQLDQGTFNGVRNGSVESFLGIQYGKPTWGDQRLRFPVPNDPYTGEHNATGEMAYACLQPSLAPVIPDGLDPQAKALLESSAWVVDHASDDCLSINVLRPSNLTDGQKIPVVIWIYGGGFEFGDASVYDGSALIQKSIDLQEPLIFVSFNYRVNAYGFLNGAEVEAAGVANIGLQDQRQAFRWVQKYISAFGGDPSKVTIWGESAGAISVGHHLIANGGDTEGLFHAAFMQSGSVIPYGDTRKGQKWYDSLVKQSGCASSNDTLECVRSTVPAEVIDAIVLHDPSPFSPEARSLSRCLGNAFNLTWVPRADGKFIRDIPYQAVLKGKVANVPFVVGDVDDEATLFTTSLTNITTEDQVHAYISSNYFPNATTSEIDELLKLYPANVTLGSPFDTGEANAVTPQFKRLAAIQGDLLFHAPRRLLLENRSAKQPVWSYLSKRSKSFPDFGSYHGTDLLNILSGGDLAGYLVNFVSHHNVNGKGLTSWPQFTPANPTLFTLLDGANSTGLERDDFRAEPIRYLNKLLLKYPL